MLPSRLTIKIHVFLWTFVYPLFMKEEQPFKPKPTPVDGVVSLQPLGDAHYVVLCATPEFYHAAWDLVVEQASTLPKRK